MSSRRAACCSRSGPASSTRGRRSSGSCSARPSSPACRCSWRRRSSWPTSPTVSYRAEERRHARSSARCCADRAPSAWLSSAGLAVGVRARLAAGRRRRDPAHRLPHLQRPPVRDAVRDGLRADPRACSMNRQYHDGFFSIVNIPRKLYALFLTGPGRGRRVPVGPAARAGRAVDLPDDAAVPVVHQGAPAGLVRHRRVGVGRSDPHPDPAARRPGRAAVRLPLRPGLLPVPVPADRPRSWRAHLVRGLDRDRHRLPREPVGHGRDLLRLVRVTTRHRRRRPSASTAAHRRRGPSRSSPCSSAASRSAGCSRRSCCPTAAIARTSQILTDWTHELVANGPGAFYRADSGYFADYPPVYLYVLWLTGLAGRAWSTAFGGADVTPFMLKLPLDARRTSGSPRSRCS